tara:strand:+ start:1419 stop:1640 length:222 start_codon:yes stop_codon:yes gene_type:complete
MKTLPERLRPVVGQLMELNEDIRQKVESISSWDDDEIRLFIHQSDRLLDEIEGITSVISDHLSALREGKTKDV